MQLRGTASARPWFSPQSKKKNALVLCKARQTEGCMEQLSFSMHFDMHQGGDRLQDLEEKEPVFAVTERLKTIIFHV